MSDGVEIELRFEFEEDGPKITLQSIPVTIPSIHSKLGCSKKTLYISLLYIRDNFYSCESFI